MNIEICSFCEGHGVITVDVGVYHSEYHTAKCSNCNGSGRVYTKMYTYTAPFTTDENHIADCDLKILETIKELMKYNHEKE